MKYLPAALSVTVMVLIFGLTWTLMLERTDSGVAPLQAAPLSIAVNPATFDAVRNQTTTVTFTNTVAVRKARLARIIHVERKSPTPRHFLVG